MSQEEDGKNGLTLLPVHLSPLKIEGQVEHICITQYNMLCCILQTMATLVGHPSIQMQTLYTAEIVY